MNPIKNVIALTVVTSSIIGLWLTPLINTTDSATYTRIYEDTEISASLIMDTLGQPNPEKVSRRKKEDKVYRRESIRSNRIKDLTPSKFSRAIHFVETPLILDDSTNHHQLVVLKDSIGHF
jgi:hypothetical protein